MGRRGLSYPLACLHDLIGIGVLGRRAEIYRQWVWWIRNAAAESDDVARENELRRAWAGLGACLSFVPVAPETEALIAECCLTGDRQDLVERMCEGVWRWRGQRQSGPVGLHSSQVRVPRIGEVERAAFV